MLIQIYGQLSDRGSELKSRIAPGVCGRFQRRRNQCLQLILPTFKQCSVRWHMLSLLLNVPITFLSHGRLPTAMLWQCIRPSNMSTRHQQILSASNPAAFERLLDITKGSYWSQHSCNASRDCHQHVTLVRYAWNSSLKKKSVSSSIWWNKLHAGFHLHIVQSQR